MQDSTIRVSAPVMANAAAANETSFESALRALNGHFYPRANDDLEMFTSRQARQHEGEPIDAIHIRIQQRVKNCVALKKNTTVKVQLAIDWCLATELRRKILKKSVMTLHVVLNKKTKIFNSQLTW